MKSVLKSHPFRVLASVAILITIAFGVVACAAPPAETTTSKITSSIEKYSLPNWNCDIESLKVTPASANVLFIAYRTIDFGYAIHMTLNMNGRFFEFTSTSCPKSG